MLLLPVADESDFQNFDDLLDCKSEGATSMNGERLSPARKIKR